MYSTEYTAVIIMLLTQLLPKVGINLDQNAITTTITTLVTLGSGLWLLVKRYQRGGITMAGVRK